MDEASGGEMMKNAVINSYFSTPVVQVRFADNDELNAELKELFLRKEHENADDIINPNRFNTQFGPLFESHFDLFKWQDKPVQKLAGMMHSTLSEFVQHINQYTPGQMQKLMFQYHAWFHITRMGGFQTLHDHPNASWSAIYYIQAGDEVPDRPESGVVRFHDKRGFSPMYLDAGNDNIEARFSWEAVPLKPETGMMLIFPSWLAHEILPYHGESERIMVALNAWIQRKA
ncbi:MAG TPA: hypothetical protein DDW55_11235 [Gammaproteobacteria bacterium]|nr:hypothetical protein [Gammaproteobacteria bacterium]